MARAGASSIVANEDGYSRSEDLPFPGNGVAEHLVFSPDASRVAFGFSTTTEPSQVWVHDFASGESRKLTDLGRVEDGVEPSLHRFASFDGESIPVFLFVPEGDGPFPVVVTIHGGPESAVAAVVLVGLRRVHAVPRLARLRGRGAERPRLERLREAVRAASTTSRSASTRSPTSRRCTRGCPRGRRSTGSRAVVYGRSYGGYMVLAALAFQPELWAAGIEFVGISNLRTFLENTSEYRRAVREREYGSLSRSASCSSGSRRGAGSTRSARRSSSSTGATTRACRSASRRRSTASSTSRGIRCELVIYEDEGHMIEKLPNRIDVLRACGRVPRRSPRASRGYDDRARRLGRVVRQRPAKPFTAVRLR